MLLYTFAVSTLAQAAANLGVSEAALALYGASDVIDLHLDTFIWRRLFGYDLHERHGLGPLGGRLFGQADIPRVREAKLTGAYWIITTQPFATGPQRARALRANALRLRAELAAHPEVRVVNSYAGYCAAKAAGLHAAFLGIQGGNCLHALADVSAAHEAGISLVTLLHFTRSPIGAPQLPPALSREPLGLRAYGVELVRALDAARMLVDLSHLHPRGFWDVVAMRDRSPPFVVSHAACAAIRPHFRNLDDDQLRAVARAGGVVGVVFNAGFLTRSFFTAYVRDVADHVMHMLRVVGDEHVCLGSDFDGAIIPPRDLRSVLELPRLAHELLRRGVPELSVQRILGGNFLRVLRDVRP
jgi:membrane dipeptidase